MPMVFIPVGSILGWWDTLVCLCIISSMHFQVSVLLVPICTLNPVKVCSFKQACSYFWMYWIKTKWFLSFKCPPDFETCCDLFFMSSQRSLAPPFLFFYILQWGSTAPKEFR